MSCWGPYMEDLIRLSPKFDIEADEMTEVNGLFGAWINRLNIDPQEVLGMSYEGGASKVLRKIPNWLQ